ncbi:DEAD/DEAH box helicase [Bradyrhizobium sp. AUGA SZCCT0169]|uniref:DEAD/DEAH box helicase n=1 Tax=Bradyrhizobium sp. AUGA SZCCT0169 TaxID=2807663 RepID=UPI001BA91A07|nr:DEAD/DEAH box helicase [Bradyrhizobium sp. AUGA SZCCT0169]MBR1247495.1 DEAD/DEAH box helicase [Bradyrhizobium sp. AUGA SZCCT0169]
MDLVAYAEELCQQRLAAYRTAPHDVEEHANIETSVLAGGYAYRQVAELIQNAADAIADASAPQSVGRIVVEADYRGLWSANTGTPVDAAGVRALLNSHASGKRAGQIGRFGLGFKSLLRLGGTIDVLSRSVCLHFDPARSRDLIRSHLNLAPNTTAPGLRLAEPGTWDEEVATAPGADRFCWASTIVFAELIAAGAREAVASEIQAFPAEFLLFLPCDVELELRTPDSFRHLRRVTTEDGSVTIEDVANDRTPPQRWRVFETSVEITDQAAKDDATTVHSRENVPLIWAAPISGVREAGRFFAFFPTTTETRTLGILNAPWKLNSDRTALIPGAWNAALMQSAAELIVANITKLATEADPGAVLDAFPRELITLTEPAAPLVNALWTLLANAPVLPNCDHELALPANLYRAPHDDPELIKQWSHLADPETCAKFLHPTCTLGTQRIGRLGRLADRLAAATYKAEHPPRLRTVSALTWIQHTATNDPHAAGDTLRFVNRYAETVRGYEWDRIRDHVRIILTAGGQLATAPEVSLAELAEPPLYPVHPFLRGEVDLNRILRTRFNVPDDETMDWEHLLSVWMDRAAEKNDWTEVWKLIRRMPWDDFTEEAPRHHIHVRTQTGWRPADEVIRPGKLIAPSDLEAISDEPTRRQISGLLLDTTFHAGDDPWLTELGVTETPASKWSHTYIPGDEGEAALWFRGWLRDHTRKYHAFLQYKPDFGLLGPDEVSMPAGWPLLLYSPPSSRSRVTAFYLNLLTTSASSEYAPVVFSHSTRRKSYSTTSYRHPFLILLLQEGVLANHTQQMALPFLLTPDTINLAGILPSLQTVGSGLAVLREKIVDEPLADEDVWSAWLRFASGERCDPQGLAGLYNIAAEKGYVPALISTEQGSLPLIDTYITTSMREISLARAAGVTAVCLAQEAAQLWVLRGARSLDQEATLETIQDGEEGQVALLLDLEPALRDVLIPDVVMQARVTLPDLMLRKLGEHSTYVDWTLKNGLLLIAQEALTSRNWHDRTTLLVDAATAAGWIDDPHAKEKVLNSGVSARRRLVAAEPDLPARLLRAAGGATRLARLFEDDVQAMLSGDPLRLAQVALTLSGPTLLAIDLVRNAMRDQGLEPPARWGTNEAADFVAAIGFPAEYGHSPLERREAELAISGPLPLKPLHDFQEDVVASLKMLLADKQSPRRRAVISLPTGAGKTRVAAETAVREVLATHSTNRLVLWIAQSDELCEQAVQCFRELWSNIGAAGETLRLIRLWGGQINPTPAGREEPTVIVASIQTLASRTNDPTLGWVSRPGLIVIDECHHALTPAYTGMLRWLSPDALNSEREPPVVGLSATPFRGRSSEETRLLASRFDNRLIPSQQGDLFEMMQKRGVLANFTYSCLKIEERFILTDVEEKHLERFQQLNDSALKRLGESVERNDKILEEITSAREKSALVFATSVEHAHRLAARLNVMGIRAASVSSETDRVSRRWFIKAFQRGEVSVLCNHSALTTGFDAPATDLIVIARPVFSPSLYMQMVGRGLRGPANGGKETCRIMTVQDNLDAYTGKLAHHYFEQHYVQQTSG